MKELESLDEIYNNIKKTSRTNMSRRKDTYKGLAVP